MVTKRKKIRRKRCDECGVLEGIKHKFRGQLLCDECLLGDMEPLDIGDYTHTACLLGQITDRDSGKDDGGLSSGSAFAIQLTKKMNEFGWLRSQEQIKQEMFYRK